MEKERIQQSLADLETHLKGIKSATEHVTSAAQACNQLCEATKAYTAQLNQVLYDIQTSSSTSVAWVGEEARKTLNEASKLVKAQAEKNQLLINEAVKNIGESATKVSESSSLLEELVKVKLTGLVDITIPELFKKSFEENEKLFKDNLTQFSDQYQKFLEESSKLLKDSLAQFTAQNQKFLEDFSEKVRPLLNIPEKIAELQELMKGYHNALSERINNAIDKIEKCDREIAELLSSVEGVGRKIDSLKELVKSQQKQENKRFDELASKLDENAKALTAIQIEQKKAKLREIILIVAALLIVALIIAR